MERIDGRKADELRPMRLTPDFTKYAEGSVLIEHGNTMVLCNASFTEGVPRFLKDSGRGWLTAEYDMLPRANRERSQRDIAKLKVSGRSAEIQRLIGRSLRSVVDMSVLGENTIVIDCDVLQGDGGTRCASITGGFVALYMACARMVKSGVLRKMPIRDYIAALGTGIIKIGGEDHVVVDMCYEEDSAAIADCNVIGTGSGKIAEVQGTGEGRPYTVDELMAVVRATMPALACVIAEQRKITDTLGVSL